MLFEPLFALLLHLLSTLLLCIRVSFIVIVVDAVAVVSLFYYRVLCRRCRALVSSSLFVHLWLDCVTVGDDIITYIVYTIVVIFLLLNGDLFFDTEFVVGVVCIGVVLLYIFIYIVVVVVVCCVSIGIHALFLTTVVAVAV